MDRQGAAQQDPSLVLTTGADGRAHQELAARALGVRHGLRFTLRRGRGLPRLHAEEHADIVAVLTDRGMVLHRGAQRLAYGTGIAELRIQRVQNREHEPLITLMGLEPGHRVLDCTLGMARDALVMAASGAEVDGVESMPLVAAFVESGLATLQGAGIEAATRVRVMRADYREVLASAPDASYHAVYFDPMFGEIVKDQPDYELFRSLADPCSLDRESIDQARRVARQVVVIKDGPRAAMLKAIGLPLKVLTVGNHVRFGVLEALPAQPKR